MLLFPDDRSIDALRQRGVTYVSINCGLHYPGCPEIMGAMRHDTRLRLAADAIYIDGFAEKGHRGLMQFMLVPQNGPENFRRWEEDFRDVYAYISSLEPPTYPYAIDEQLAARGRAVSASPRRRG